MTAPDVDDRTLQTQRVLAAPPGRVWQAFADPAQLARWWGPDGFTNEFETFTFEPGGRWDLTMVGPTGARYWNESRFAELDAPHRLVIAHDSAPRFVLTVTLTAEAEGTRLTWSQCFDTAELCYVVAPICEPANEQNLDRLAGLLAAPLP
jgi:uncharacterized protein YndB with AHSA1/START domain